jgi:hypothetical protein
MSRTLTLPDELVEKLAHGAARRGMTIEALLSFVSDLVVTKTPATEREKARSRQIERLLEKHRAGRVTDKDRAVLDELIDADYEAAIARADPLIAAKNARTDSPLLPRSRRSHKPAKQPRK